MKGKLHGLTCAWACLLCTFLFAAQATAATGTLCDKADPNDPYPKMFQATLQSYDKLATVLEVALLALNPLIEQAIEDLDFTITLDKNTYGIGPMIDPGVYQLSLRVDNADIRMQMAGFQITAWEEAVQTMVLAPAVSLTIDGSGEVVTPCGKWDLKCKATMATIQAAVAQLPLDMGIVGTSFIQQEAATCVQPNCSVAIPVTLTHSALQLELPHKRLPEATLETGEDPLAVAGIYDEIQELVNEAIENMLVVKMASDYNAGVLIIPFKLDIETTGFALNQAVVNCMNGGCTNSTVGGNPRQANRTANVLFFALPLGIAFGLLWLCRRKRKK